MSDIQLAPSVTITADEAVTGTRAILGIRGSGKTTTAVSTTEHIIRAGYCAGVLDPLDVWWGLRSSKDGNGPGLPVYVFGGPHADAPLEPTAGAIMARWLMKSRVSVVLSLKHMPHAGQTRFVTDFALAIYQHNDQPLHIVIDEVARFCPQQVRPDMARCVGAIQDLGSEGRASGIGTTVIGQRAARVNKDVLTQAQTLICMQTVSALDRKAIAEWIGENGDEEARKQMMRDIASLPIGTGYYYAPREGAPRRVEFFDRTTFDSSATPKVGKPRPQPKVFAVVDLASLRGEIEASVEAAKADDPKALRARIAELETKIELKAIGGAVIAFADDLAAMERRAQAAERDWRTAVAQRDQVVGIAKILTKASRETALAVMGAVERLTLEVDRANASFEAPPPLEQRPQAPRQSAPVRSATSRPAEGSDEPGRAVGGGEQKILDAIAQRDPKPSSKTQVGLISGYSPRSSTFDTYISRLRAAGLVESAGPGLLQLTEAGRAKTNVTAPRSSRDVQAFWLERIGGGEAKLLQVLLAAYPEPVHRPNLAHESGYSVTSSTFDTYCSRLVSAGLATRSAGMLRASADLFPAGQR